MRSLLIMVVAALVVGVSQVDSQGRRAGFQSSGLEGRVLNAITGEPVRNAELILRRADLSPNAYSPTTYTVITDDAGRFVMGNIEPGRYRLSAARSGFVSTEYGSHSSAPGATLSIDPARPLRDIIFRLSPQAVIAGRLTDAEGDPVSNIQVQAVRFGYIQGKRQLLSFGRVPTNDRGEYRLAGLPPGRYYITATFPPAVLLEASVASSDTQTDQQYVSTYYPGTQDRALAIPIEVTQGSEASSINFALSKTRTVRIRGRITSSEGGGSSMVTVTLVSAEQGSDVRTSRTFVTNPNGDFAIGGITPGAYTFIASILGNGRYVSAKKPLDATNDVDDFTVVVTPGAEVRGSFQVEGEAKPNLTGLRISLLPFEQHEFVIPLPNTQVNQDGTFTLSNIAPDRYYLAAFELPDGFYLKSVRNWDVELLDAGLDLSAEVPDAITAVLAQGAAEISGMVQDGQGRAALGALVVLVPNERRNQPQYYRSTTTDQYGRFILRNVVPGAYKFFTRDDLEYDALMAPDFTKTVEDAGQPITVQEKTVQGVRLKLAPGDQSQHN